MIRKHIMDAILKDVHQEIDETATSIISQLKSPDIFYPPNIEITNEEKIALSSLDLSEAAQSGLKKLVSSTCAKPLFQLFCMLDGVTDPTGIDEIWTGVRMTERATDDKGDEDFDMLHDEFFETSWLYKDWTKE